MRWTWPKRNSIRKRTAFLLFPRRVGNEWRWLERATWEEKAIYHEGCLAELKEWEWVALRWIDGEE